jgi:hypothetical protein
VDYNMGKIQGNSLSPSGTSELGIAKTKIDMAERNISMNREFLQVCLGNRHHGILAGFNTRGQS